jgi:Tfp pilus assembly protein PilF
MRALFLVVAVALAGCASAPATQVPRQLFADERYLAAPRPPTNEDLFALSEEMRHFADTEIAAQVVRSGLHDGLAIALRRELQLEYDASSTLPAADTFARRSGNCLSLVILSAAFAKHLDVPLSYQIVYGEEAWSRVDGIAFLSMHVNVKLGPRGMQGPSIDFAEAARFERTTTRPIDEQTVRAMYLNNRAAEAIVAGEVGTAYWWARAAVEAAPWYTNGINTLAVVHLRHGHLGDAERALRLVLDREPANGRAMTNLVSLLARDGREPEAQQWRERLAALEPYPPFFFLDQGLAALSDGRPETARELLQKELRRMPYYHEVHFALAVADWRLGDVQEARNHLDLALKYSTTRDRRDIYGAKLARLKALAAE